MKNLSKQYLQKLVIISIAISVVGGLYFDTIYGLIISFIGFIFGIFVFREVLKFCKNYSFSRIQKYIFMVGIPLIILMFSIILGLIF